MDKSLKLRQLYRFILEDWESGLAERSRLDTTSSDGIISTFCVIFPEMQVEQDSDGQVIIYTGIYEE